jgi:hypothetical protein
MFAVGKAYLNKPNQSSVMRYFARGIRRLPTDSSTCESLGSLSQWSVWKLVDKVALERDFFTYYNCCLPTITPLILYIYSSMILRTDPLKPEIPLK